MNKTSHKSNAGMVSRSIRTAVSVPRWALQFYCKHFLIVIALSIPGAIHRFIAISRGWGADLAITANLALAIITATSRLLLVGFVIWHSMTHDNRLSQLNKHDIWKRVKAFIRFRWPSLIAQLFLIACAFLVFGVFLEKVVVLWIPSDFVKIYSASLLAVKNLTVIAWFFIWMVGIILQMILHSPVESKDNETAPMHSDISNKLH